MSRLSLVLLLIFIGILVKIGYKNIKNNFENSNNLLE